MVRGGSRRSGGSAPLAKDPARYKTELCSTWIRSGGCPYGHKCQFAHGVDELRARQDQPSSYKTKVCRSFSRGGRCPYGARCRFVHGDVMEAQQLAMLRLMGESPSMQLQLPLSQSQPPSPCLRSTCPPILSSTCPPTPLLGPFTQSLLPTGPLDLSSHSGALHPSVQLLQQAQLSQHQLIKPMQPHEDSRTCSSYASSLFSSSHYPSPQLMPLAVSQPLLSTHQTPQHTPLLVPAWQEHAVDFPHAPPPSASPAYQAQAHGSPLSPIAAMPTGGCAAFLPFALPPPLPAAVVPPQVRGVDDFKLELGAGADRYSTLMDDRGKGPLSVGESLFGGDELGLQYTQCLAEQLAQMCMTE